jgi:hypothetical protein
MVDCPNYKTDYRLDPSKTVCLLCHAPKKLFVRFAPCTKNCIDRIFWQSTGADPGVLGDGLFRRRYTTNCHLADPERMAVIHKPAIPARIHKLYCSLRCYNSVAYGHETRRLEGQRRRSRRHEGGGWRNRWRQEKGYFRVYRRLKRMKQDRLMLYGDDRSDAELRTLDQLREAAAADPDFEAIFGKQPEGE